MSQISFGDLGATYQGRLQNGRLKAEMQRLSEELASGRTSNLREATGGDLGNFASIDNAIKSLDSFKVSANEAGLFVDAMQRSLETVQAATSEIGPALLLAGSANEATLVQTAAADAKSRFETVVSVLNTKIADRALLSGTEIGNDALASPDTMLADLQLAIAAETTAAGVETMVDAWFDDVGGGFETIGYTGGTDDLAPFRVGPGESVELPVRADSQQIRDVLKGYAMAALVADGALSGIHDERVALVSTAGTRLLTGDHALTDLRASVGTVESRVESAKARNGAETTSLEIARSGIVEVDGYRTATDLQAAEAQLQMLYTITARMSRLSLAEFL